MSNIELIDETQVLTPEVETTLETSTEQEPNLTPTPSDTELNVKTEEIATTAEDNQPEEEKPKTPEELKQEENARREAGKISSLEKERNEYSLKASVYEKGIESASKMTNPETAIDELSRLVSNKKEYEKLQPVIAKVLPQFNNLSFDEFSAQVDQALTSQAKEDPAKYENINKLERQKMQAEFEEQKNLEIGKIRQQAVISTIVPAFADTLKTNPQQAQLDYDFALNKAVTTANYLIGQNKEFNFDQLVANELSTLNPIYSNGGKAIKQLQDGLNQMVKGASTTQPNAGTLDTLKLSPELQAIYTERLETWMSRGKTKEEAHKLALAVVQ
jgi:hypothetical protein